MGERCPAVYVTVSFIASAMMKLVCLRAFEITPRRYLDAGIFIAAIIQTCAAAVCIYVYRSGDTAA